MFNSFLCQIFFENLIWIQLIGFREVIEHLLILVPKTSTKSFDELYSSTTVHEVAIRSIRPNGPCWSYTISSILLMFLHRPQISSLQVSLKFPFESYCWIHSLHFHKQCIPDHGINCIKTFPLEHRCFVLSCHQRKFLLASLSKLFKNLDIFHKSPLTSSTMKRIHSASLVSPKNWSLCLNRISQISNHSRRLFCTSFIASVQKN